MDSPPRRGNKRVSNGHDGLPAAKKSKANGILRYMIQESDRDVLSSSRSNSAQETGELDEIAVLEGDQLPSTVQSRETPLSEKERHAINAYPSVLDVPPPLTTHINASENGDLTFEDLFRPHKFVDGGVLLIGDILRIEGSNEVSKAKLVKYVEITCGYKQRNLPIPHGFPATTRPVRNSSFTVGVPPGTHKRSDPMHPAHVFPDPFLPTPIRGPTAIIKAVKNVSTSFSTKLVSNNGLVRVNLWDSIIVTRPEGAWLHALGCLNDIRLGLQFAMNENDFQAQLTFIGGRSRMLGKNASQAGFYLSHDAGLYLKVKPERLAALNQDLVINLGSRLNTELASLASPGYAIVMVDARIIIRDGLPVPAEREFAEVLKYGPKAFTDRFTKKLAGSNGWTNGWAHMSLKALCGNEKGESSMGVFRYANRASREKTATVPEEEKVLWTKEEIKTVDKFHERKLQGRVRHYPLPLNRSRRSFGIIVTQYERKDDRKPWEVSTDVHGSPEEVHRVAADKFEEAKTKLRAHKAVQNEDQSAQRHHASSNSTYKPDGDITGYNTLGRHSAPPHERNSAAAVAGMGEDTIMATYDAEEEADLNNERYVGMSRVAKLSRRKPRNEADEQDEDEEE